MHVPKKLVNNQTNKTKKEAYNKQKRKIDVPSKNIKIVS